MFKWLRELFADWNQVQKELNEMGIFQGTTHLTSWTHIDETQFKKYLNDRRNTIPENNRQTKA